MIQCSWEMNPRLAGHGNSLSNNDAHVNTELTKPDPTDHFRLLIHWIPDQVRNGKTVKSFLRYTKESLIE
jgi:hypothetical protein